MRLSVRWIAPGIAGIALILAACGGADDAADAGPGTPDGTVTPRVSATPGVSATAGADGVAHQTPAPSSGVVASVTAGPTPLSPPGAVTTPDPALGAPPYFSTELLTLADLAARGSGQAGRGPFNIARIVIGAIEVDGPVASGVVAANGVMPSPPDRNTAIWYDFSQFPGLGGLPGAGGNVVIGGDAGRVGEGTGIFAKLGRVPPGAFVRLQLTDGAAACYRVAWNKLATSAIDFSSIVQATATESVTLISAGRTADERRVVWGTRASCGAEPTPTPSVRVGHHKMTVVAEGRRITIVSGDPVPLGIHTVDYTMEYRDAGVTHQINVFDGTGKQISDWEPWTGPVTVYHVFGIGPPISGAGTWEFRCSIHPEMVTAFTVLSNGGE
jgi:hypothetical protein